MVNTAPAYDQKTAEFYQFCVFLYILSILWFFVPNATPRTKYTVDADKAFIFLPWHAQQVCDVNGKAIATSHGFDGDNYNKV